MGSRLPLASVGLFFLLPLTAIASPKAIPGTSWEVISLKNKWGEPSGNKSISTDWANPDVNMGFPYEDTSVYLDIRECDTVYFLFNNTPNIANTVTHEGYDSLELDYKIDGKEYNIVAYQDWGESNVYLHESSESRFISQSKGSNEVKVAIDWFGEGYVTFTFDIRGCEKAYNQFGTYLPKCRNAGKPFQYWLFSKNLHESTEVKLLSPPNYFAV